MTTANVFRVNPDTDRIHDHIRALEGVRHPTAAPVALDRAATYVATALERLGCEMSEQLFADNGRLFRNIIATCRGSVHPEERILVLAHYDTVAGSPGADDNASGVAVMLETAALLAAGHFERTVQFIGVSLEENAREGEHGTGTRGSRALARHAREEGWSIAAAVVLESVAFAGGEIVQTAPSGLPVVVPATGNFIAAIGNERSRPLIDRFVSEISRQGLKLPCLPLAVPGNGETLPDSRRSDHAPFWDAGYPAIMLTDTTNFRNPHYHRATDTLATLNLDFAALVCNATAAFVAELARPLPAK